MHEREYFILWVVWVLSLTVLAVGLLIGLDTFGVWTAIGSTASGLVGMLLGAVVLFWSFWAASA